MIFAIIKFLALCGIKSFRIIIPGLGLLIASFFHAAAQHNNELVVKGCTLSIQNNANLIIQGDFLIEGNNARLNNNGYLELQGNMYSDSLFQQRGAGTTRFHNRSVNIGQAQFIEGNCAVRGGTGAIGADDGSFFVLELANSSGIVWLNGNGNVADVRSAVDFQPSGTGSPLNRIITHNPLALPSSGSGYSAVFGMMNSSSGLTNFRNNSVSTNGNVTSVDSGYVQGKLRRAISPAGGVYGFVIGTQPSNSATNARGIQYAHLNLNANTYDVFTCCFNPASPNVIFGSPVECNYYMNYFGGATHGEWYFSESGSGAGNYELRIWPQDYSVVPQVAYILTQNDAVMGIPNDCGPSEIGLARGGFSGSGFFGFAGGSNLLAENTLTLEANVTGPNSIELVWSQEEENTTSYFEIEKGFGPNSFSNLGKKIISSAGLYSDYMFLDSNVVPGTSYFYRIRAVSLDGEISYSNISEAMPGVTPDPGNLTRVFPNPSSGGRVNIEWQNEKEEVALMTVHDVTGKLIFTEPMQAQKGTNRRQLDTGPWSAGIYFFSISAAQEITGKIVVE